MKMTDSVNYVIATPKPYVCPKGHTVMSSRPPTVEVDGHPESKRMICNVCYVEWMGDQFPTALGQE
jgi:hypothetical protein